MRMRRRRFEFDVGGDVYRCVIAVRHRLERDRNLVRRLRGDDALSGFHHANERDGDLERQ